MRSTGTGRPVCATIADEVTQGRKETSGKWLLTQKVVCLQTLV